MTVASRRMPSPRAVAKIFTSVPGVPASDANAGKRMRAAPVTRRPVRDRPATVASVVEPRRSYSSRMRTRMKTS
jgi:hypothetical protein